MADTTIQQKTCTRCKAFKPVAEFCRNRSRRDGLNSECRSCYRTRIRYVPYKSTETRTQSARFTADELAHEEWRTIPGFEDYKVSSLGRIESSRSTQTGYKRKARIFNERKPATNGYILISLRADGIQSMRTLHSIVLETFVGPRPEGMEGCHNNGVRHDCRLTNLRWDTTKANHEDSVRHGTHNHSGFELGRKPRLFRYTPEQLRWILDNRSVYSKQELSARSGVHLSTVKRMLQGCYNPLTLA